MESVIEIRSYITRNGRDVYDDWFSNLSDARAPRLPLESTVSLLAILETASASDEACANCELIGDRVIGFITLCLATFAFCCSVVATRGRKRLTLKEH
jgi:hypothetical protein